MEVYEGVEVTEDMYPPNISVPMLRDYRHFLIQNPKTNRKSQRFICDFEENGSYCCKEFVKWHNLFDHLRIHNKEKPFECPVKECSHAYS